MSSQQSDKSAAYAEALRAYLVSADESARERAYEIGRESFVAGGGLLAFAELHARAMQAFLETATPGQNLAQSIARANEFFSEGLSAFEMALRGYRETNDHLRDLNTTLESRVRERTHELQASNAKLYALLDAAPVGLIATNDELVIDWCNPRAGAKFAAADDDLANRPLFDVVDQLRKYRERFERVLGGESFDFTDTIFDRNGEGRIHDVRLRPVQAEGRVIGTLGVFVDITAHKKAEEARLSLERQVRVAQRMEAIGRLAGGIAHDFNNVLTVIMAYSMFVMERLDADDPSRQELEIIVGAAERAARLTSQLLAFSRRRVQQLEVVKINDTVVETERMLRRVLGEHIELIVDLQPDIAPIRADLSQIEQVLLNLAVNARDAMPEGGKLTIETRNVDFSTGLNQPRGDDLPPGSYVMVAVSDTGHGMDEATQSRIFEPFFTTKQAGQGTGLGLATVYGTVRQHDGAIWVYSEPGRGTTFKVYLPQITDPDRAAPRPRPLAQTLHGAETILVVEDEDLVRQAAVRILAAHGYHVLSAARAAAAAEIVESGEERVDLLITDIVMPEMSGQALVERLEQSAPGLRTLFMSGFTDNAVVQHGVLTSGTPFLQKPFSPDSLLQRVREVLDAAE